ncbi:hypothetical protein N234_22630 [Ralstonia pickettii DTP0602]|nr:hypothetical protein N234_22630 [Ralstonia pickettii DTP0602]
MQLCCGWRSARSKAAATSRKSNWCVTMWPGFTRPRVIQSITVGKWLLSPTLMELGNANLVIFFLLMLVTCVVIGVPIAFAFGLATLSYLALSTATPLSIIPNRMQDGMSHLILLAVPLFVFLGGLIEMTGLARAMISFLVTLIGHVRGGLQHVLLGAMYIVSGISGAKAADMAAVAPALFPEMRKRGARDGDLIGLLSASGAMSETIPPSIVLITVGSVTGVSITSLFIGGLMPAVVGLVMMAFVVWSQTRREDMSAAVRAPRREILRSLLVALPALALPVIIRSAVVEGMATATEVSTIGIFYTVLAGVVVYRQFDWRRIYPMLLDTAALSGAILLIVGCATTMAWALTQSGLPRTWSASCPPCQAARSASCSFLRWPLSSWAACWRASPRSCCSGPCCSRLRSWSACMRCTTRWW